MHLCFPAFPRAGGERGGSAESTRAGGRSQGPRQDPGRERRPRRCLSVSAVPLSPQPASAGLETPFKLLLPSGPHRTKAKNPQLGTKYNNGAAETRGRWSGAAGGTAGRGGPGGSGPAHARARSAERALHGLGPPRSCRARNGENPPGSGGCGVFLLPAAVQPR